MSHTKSLQDLLNQFYIDRVPQTRSLTHVVATVTASGDTVVYTPSVGKRIILWWVYCINDPDESSSPLIKIKLGSEEKYRVYALSKTQKVIGETNGSLIVSLDSVGNVAVSVLLEEVDESET